MIPFIRSHLELMAITGSRECKEELSGNNEIYNSTVDSAQRKRYIRSLEKHKVDLPSLPKTIRRKWVKDKDALSKLINDLSYNNQIESSYDLYLIAKQDKSNKKDVA